MDAAQCLSLARRWWWLALAGAVIAVAAYGIASKLRPAEAPAPAYAAGATLLVRTTDDPTDAGSETSRGEAIDRLVATYAAMIEGPSVAERAAELLGSAESSAAGGAVKADSIDVRADPVGRTQLLRITATGATPAEAEQLTGTVVRAFGEVHRVQALPGRFSVYESTPAARQPVDIQPRALTIVLVAFGGMLAACAVIFAFEYLSDVVRDAGDAERSTGINVLTAIPVWRANRGIASRVGPRAAERYRMLRTAVRMGVSRQVQTLLVTGARPGDGATTTAVNYAVALAQTGRSVLIIDCNLRAPSAHRAFGIGGYAGLADLLASGGAVFDQFVRPTGVEGLSLLPAGEAPENPAELLESERFDRVLAEARRRFTAVVLDAPALLDTTDATLVAARADGAVLVLRCDATPRGDASAAAESLRRAGVNVVGAVLNRDPAAAGSGLALPRIVGAKPLPAEVRPR
jgi:capsular exopolysaccharide synthesis family protein